MTRIVVRRAKIVPYLVSQSQLGDFGWDTAIIIDEGDDASVETSFSGSRVAGHVLCVDFVAFTNTTRCARR